MTYITNITVTDTAKKFYPILKLVLLAHLK